MWVVGVLYVWTLCKASIFAAVKFSYRLEEKKEYYAVLITEEHVKMGTVDKFDEST